MRGQRFELIDIRPRADDGRRDLLVGVELGQRLQQHVDAFELPQLTDEQEVRGVLGRHMRSEVVGPQAIWNDADGDRGLPRCAPHRRGARTRSRR